MAAQCPLFVEIINEIKKNGVHFGPEISSLDPNMIPIGMEGEAEILEIPS